MRPPSIQAFVLAVLGSTLAPSLAPGQEAGSISRTTAEIMREAALRGPQPDKAPQALETFLLDPGSRRDNAEAPLVSTTGALGPVDEVAPAVVGPLAFPSVTTPNFTSVTYPEALVRPPDSSGAVGPTQFLTHVNGRIRVHSKADGSVGSLNVDDELFWAPVVKAPHSYVGQPRVRFDRLSSRWFMLVGDIPSNVGSTAASASRLLIAMSDGATITASTVWKLFYFDVDLVSPLGDTSCLADFASLAVDASALYLGAVIVCGPDMSTLAFSNTSAFVVRKSMLLAPATPSNLAATAGAVTAFRSLMDPGTGAGLLAPFGADNTDPGATKGYLVGVDGLDFSTLVVREVTNPATAPALGPNKPLTVPLTRLPTSVQTPGGGRPLSGLDDRLLAAHLRNGRLWTAHQIQVDASGVASTTGGRNGVRWYEIDPTPTPPALVQSGTIFDPATVSPLSYWVGTPMVSGQGHTVFGFTAAGPTTAPGAGVVGRLASDAAGTTPGAPLVYKAADANYVDTQAGGSAAPWGYISTTSLDPCDDMSMWTIQEFATTPASGTFNWGTRVVRLLAPPPATPSAAAPSSVSSGLASVAVTITGASSGGSGFYETPSAGMPPCRTRLAAAVTRGIVVNSISYVSPTSVTLDLDTRAASPGAASVTITNPDGQQATASILSIPGAGAALSARKTVSGSFAPGGSLAYEIVITNLGSSAQADNSGNELTDVLPSTLSLVSATATGGVASANPATRTVAWNGPLAAGGSVTITVNATLGIAVAAGTPVSNQGTTSYDADGNGTNETSGVTDDPALPGASDPTSFTVAGGATSFYRTVTPCRVFDTREPGPQTATGALPNPGPHAFRIQGDCGVPVGATAVTANVTVVTPTAGGDLRLFPASAGQPLVSTLNWSAGENAIANGAILPLARVSSDAEKDLAMVIGMVGSGAVHVLIDITGYFR